MTGAPTLFPVRALIAEETEASFDMVDRISDLPALTIGTMVKDRGDALPSMSVTVDVAVLSRPDDHDDLMVVLVRRANEPQRGSWVLPGGFVELEEDLPVAAARELSEETGIRVDPSSLRQLGAYGAPGRDPRGRVVTVAFWVEIDDLESLEAGSDAAECRLMSVSDLLARPAALGFDHAGIIADAVSAAGSSLAP